MICWTFILLFLTRYWKNVSLIFNFLFFDCFSIYLYLTAEKSLCGLHPEAIEYLRSRFVYNGSIGHTHQKCCSTDTETKMFSDGLVCLGTASLFQISRFFLFYGGCFVCGCLTTVILHERLLFLSKRKLLRPEIFEDFVILRLVF
jgi:hypothetical protein